MPRPRHGERGQFAATFAREARRALKGRNADPLYPFFFKGGRAEEFADDFTEVLSKALAKEREVAKIADEPTVPLWLIELQQFQRAWEEPPIAQAPEPSDGSPPPTGNETPAPGEPDDLPVTGADLSEAAVSSDEAPAIEPAGTVYQEPDYVAESPTSAAEYEPETDYSAAMPESGTDELHKTRQPAIRKRRLYPTEESLTPDLTKACTEYYLAMRGRLEPTIQDAWMRLNDMRPEGMKPFKVGLLEERVRTFYGSWTDWIARWRSGLAQDGISTQ
jgi:hypothetical protein